MLSFNGIENPLVRNKRSLLYRGNTSGNCVKFGTKSENVMREICGCRAIRFEFRKIIGRITSNFQTFQNGCLSKGQTCEGSILKYLSHDTHWLCTKFHVCITTGTIPSPTCCNGQCALAFLLRRSGLDRKLRPSPPLKLYIYTYFIQNVLKLMLYSPLPCYKVTINPPLTFRLGKHNDSEENEN